jgi:prevent-host-death family protein
MSTIPANDLKTRGVTVVEEHLREAEEVLISVRGKEKYVVMSIDKYARLRELELDRAIAEARADYDAGRVISESVEEHMKRVTDGV